MKEEDYKYDYRKYILEKRKLAYDELEKLLIRLGRKKIRRTGDGPLHNIFVESTTTFDPVWDFMTMLTEVINKHRFWLSVEIFDLLVDLNLFLGTYSKLPQFKGVEKIDAGQLEDVGTSNFEEIERRRKLISNQFFQDIRELDNVEKYKRDRRKF